MAIECNGFGDTGLIRRELQPGTKEPLIGFKIPFTNRELPLFGQIIIQSDDVLINRCGIGRFHWDLVYEGEEINQASWILMSRYILSVIPRFQLTRYYWKPTLPSNNNQYLPQNPF